MVTQVAEIDDTPLEVLNDSLSDSDPKETRCFYFSVSFISFVVILRSFLRSNYQDFKLIATVRFEICKAFYGNLFLLFKHFSWLQFLFAHRQDQMFLVATQRTILKRSSSWSTCLSTHVSSRLSMTPYESCSWHPRTSVASASSSARRSGRPSCLTLSCMTTKTAPNL